MEAEPPEDEEDEFDPEGAAPAEPSYLRCPKCGWARAKCDDPDCPGLQSGFVI